MSHIEIPHWAALTPAQQAAIDAGRRDFEQGVPARLTPEYADPVERACYLHGRKQAQEDEVEFYWQGRN